MSRTDSLSQEGSELVADHLDACFRDQALSGKGWDALQHMWRVAERHIADAEDLWVWVDGGDESREKEARQHLVAAAASLLDLASHVDAMRRAAR
jgi:hypothetical protein